MDMESSSGGTCEFQWNKIATMFFEIARVRVLRG